jgi:hypothetical protein
MRCSAKLPAGTDRERLAELGRRLGSDVHYGQEFEGDRGKRRSTRPVISCGSATR